MSPVKHIAVVVTSSGVERVREALRAAVGLSLRGDRVHVTLGRPWLDAGDPAIDRAIATLRALGHGVNGVDPRTCDAVEVWT